MLNFMTFILLSIESYFAINNNKKQAKISL